MGTPVAGTSKKVGYNKIEGLIMGAASVAADGITFDISNARNEEVVLVFQNTDASNAYDITIKAPTNGGYAATDVDLTLADIAAGAIAVARIEKAKYANNSGLVKLVPENISVKAMAVI